jgi:hypothetical protein
MIQVKINEQGLKWLNEDNGELSYTIQTKKGLLHGSGFPDKEAARIHLEEQLSIIVKAMLVVGSN